jgi:ribosomal protein S18 acetylase RimI-like enzyme
VVQPILPDHVRPATLEDLPALLALEQQAFDSDRLSRRSFRRMITRAHADLVVFERESIGGYALVLYHRNTQLARLYSIAVDAQWRGHGVGAVLLDAAERCAVGRGCVTMRLEFRRGSRAAEQLYRRAGYREFGQYLDYYEDHSDAVRMEKSLGRHLHPTVREVPYYHQSTEFTCGPAALMMAMSALDPGLQPDRKLELRLWRESTTIFMMSGPGGCGPFGLALAAAHRGFDVRVWVSEHDALFVDSVRSEQKKAVIRLVHEDMAEEIASRGIPVSYTAATLEELEAAHEDGALAVVLISSWQIYRERTPHWVVITGFDEHFVYTHDPFIEPDSDRSVLDSINMPIRRETFAGMARYGRRAQRAAIVISPGRARA